MSLQFQLKSKRLGALLISNFYNILYLTGFKTMAPEEREAFGLVTAKNIYLITDGRYLEKEEKKDDITYRILTPEKRLIQHLQEILKTEGIKRLGFEAEDLKYHEYKVFKNKLKTTLVPTKGLITQLRQIKRKDEIVKLKLACRVADQCLREIIKTVKVGQSEKEIAFKIEAWLKAKGHGISFAPIVAVDANAALPHYFTQAGAGKVKRGSLLLIDYGAKVNDYCSDTTRVFFMGKPKDEYAKVYSKLLRAQEKTIQYIKKARQLKEIDSFCRKELGSFPHSTGHGVGLEVHESPLVSYRLKDKLQANQVFTIEPGVYVPGKYGMRIEDMIWVKSSSVEVLTKLPKKLSSVVL